MTIYQSIMNKSIELFNKNRPRIFLASIFILSYVIYFSFGVFHISKFETADTHFWIGQRIDHYWNAVFAQKWEKTRINDKPGITLAIISGSVDLKNRLMISLGAKTNLQTKVIPDKVERQEKEFRRYRLPILIFNGFFCLYFFWIILKITSNHRIALWSFVLILLSPILLGMSQIDNPDSFLWTFMTATIFSFVALLNNSDKKFVWLTTLFLGLAVLSKYTAAILYPFLFIITLIFYFFSAEKWKVNTELGRKNILRISLSYLLIVLGSLATFALLMPASILIPSYLFEGTIGYPGIKKLMLLICALQLLLLMDALIFRSHLFTKIAGAFFRLPKLAFKILPAILALIFLTVLANWNSNFLFLNPADILEKSHELAFLPSANYFQTTIYQFSFLVFAVPPLVVFAAIFAWTRRIWQEKKYSFLSDIISLFILLYYFALIVEGLPATVRYSIVLYPLLSVVAAIGIEEFFSQKKLEKIKKIWISLFIILLSFVSFWLIKPFYFNYASELLPKKYALSYAWGFGGYEAAQYLNSLPNAENIVVWSDYYGFRNFFRGITYDNLILKKDAQKIDYFVLTQKGRSAYDYWCRKAKSRCQKRYAPAWKYYDATNPVWERSIDDRPENFIKIFKNEE
jgi:4-amino-4-deoxy-L-arabinose transferase-like glycosyltransferase